MRAFHAQMAAAILNHVLTQNPSARLALQKHAGRVLCVAFSPFTAHLQILETGFFAASDAEVEATLRLKSSLLLQKIQGKAPLPQDVEILGDSALALSVARVLGRLRWDFGEDAAKLIGDRAAAKLERLFASALQIPSEYAARAYHGGAEFLRDEGEFLAQRAQFLRFKNEIAELRDASARAEKRLKFAEQAWQNLKKSE